MTTDDMDAGERVRQILAQRIREAREGKTMTRKDLAAGITALGVPTTADSVRQWENAVAAPRWLMSVAIAQVLGYKWSELFNLDRVTL